MAKGKGSNSGKKTLSVAADRRFRVHYTIPELWNMGDENRRHVLGDKYDEYAKIYGFDNNSIIPPKANLQEPEIGGVEETTASGSTTSTKKTKTKRKASTGTRKKAASKTATAEEEPIQEDKTEFPTSGLATNADEPISSGDTVQIEKQDQVRDYKF